MKEREVRAIYSVTKLRGICTLKVKVVFSRFFFLTKYFKDSGANGNKDDAP